MHNYLDERASWVCVALRCVALSEVMAMLVVVRKEENKQQQQQQLFTSFVVVTTPQPIPLSLSHRLAT
jgi:uncharacterized membrane protein SirB2